MTPATDERQGLPSASHLHQLSLCPGSHRAQAGIPDQPDPDAASGTAIHDVLAGDALAEHLTPDQQETAAACAPILDQVLFKVGLPMDAADQRDVEQRLWLKQRGVPIFSGKADLFLRWGSVGLVVDYKTGRTPVPEADVNLQLAGLALLASVTWVLETVHVAIIQPHGPAPGYTLATYDADGLAKVCDSVLRIVEAARAEDAPRRPSIEACRYCKAKAQCPESLAITLALQRQGSVDALAPHELGSLLLYCKLAEDVIDAARTEAKRRLADGLPVPGWTLKPGAVKGSIINPEAVWAACQAQGVPLIGFMSAVTIAKGKLKDAIRLAKDVKGKELDGILATVLDGNTESKQNAPSLVREG